ncbi:MAG TPA: hypothetical protein VFH56_06460 [Acidimicrobiales bacterium]|nr:hypothetical protein [Acidimicrobiales bacterium]
MARHSRDGLRWRDRPRLTLLRWNLGRGFVLYVIVVGVAWWAVVAYGWAAISGHGGPAGEHSRLHAAGWTLLALAVSLLLTRIAWLYLRRPVRREHD